MSKSHRYILTIREGRDRLHRDPGEQCNLDDTTADLPVHPEVAAELRASGAVELCKHDDWESD